MSSVFCLLFFGSTLKSSAEVYPRQFEINVLYSDEYKTVVELKVYETPVESVYVMESPAHKLCAGGMNLYHRIRIPDEVRGGKPGATFDIGKPELPGIFRMVGIPDGASFRATVLEMETDTIKGLLIYPLQPPTTEDEDKSSAEVYPRQFVIDEDFYESDILYPAHPVSLDNPGVWRDISVVVLRLYPFSCNLASRALIVYKRLVVQISYEGRRFTHKKVSPNYFRMYKSAILNFKSMNIDEGYPPDSLQYLVIAQDSLLPAISPLVNWHRKQGIDIAIVPTCSVGTTPQTIKSYIAAQYQTYSIEYVLFVGDVEHIPLYEWDTYPSQYWYACITGDSVPDLYPDLTVSRFSVKDTAKLTTQINKTLKYLKNPPLDTWLTRSILCAHQETSLDNYANFKENIRNYIYSFFNPDFDTAYGRSDGRTAQVVSAISQGRNIINYRGHGSRTAWTSWDCNGDYLYDTDIMYLTNTRTPIVLNMCCSTGDIGGWTDCLCETWMNAEGGAVAVYGATRVTNTEPHNIFDEHFYKAFCNILPGIFGFGDIVYFAYGQTVIYGPQAEANAKQCILLGDPMVEVGTGIPESLVVQHDSIISLVDSDIIVTVISKDSLPIKRALVCVMKENEVYKHGLTGDDGMITFPISLTTPGILWVTVTTHGYLPYEGYALTDTLPVFPIPAITRELLKVFPNPSRSLMKVQYFVSHPSGVVLNIYDISGRLVWRFVDKELGIRTIIWEGKDLDRKKVSKGIYFIQLQSCTSEIVRKAVLIR